MSLSSQREMRVRTPLPGAARRGQAQVPRRGRVRHRGETKQVLLVTLCQLRECDDYVMPSYLGLIRDLFIFFILQAALRLKSTGS